LLSTAVFPEFNTAIIKALGFSSETIETIRSAMTLVIRGDDNTYRYHDLFRAFLEDRLEYNGLRGETLLHASAAVEVANPALSLTLAIRANDHATILRLIEAHGLALIERGQTEIVSAALETLNEADR